MPLPGQRSDPIRGVKGSKPTRRRLPKLPATPDAADLQEQSSIYLRERNRAMHLRRIREEMLLAKERGRLIEKRLVGRQLSFFLVAFRQQALLVPKRMRHRFRDGLAPEQAEYLDQLIHGLLTTLQKLPESAEPGWLEKAEEE
jgi:hypothetical protein